MKKILFIISSMLITSMCFVSCLKDDIKSTANVSYMGMVDSIWYTSQADTVWSNNIVEALVNMKIHYNRFEMSDTTESSLYSVAVANCHNKAADAFNSQLETITLAEIKKSIFKAHSDSLIDLGIPRADSIPLAPFKLRSSLWNYYDSRMVCYYLNDIK